MKKYNPNSIEKKWQRHWASKKTFVARLPSPAGSANGGQAKDNSKTNPSTKLGVKKFILVEFPFPSGSSLHMGHLRPYTAGDIVSKYHRMNGKNVMYPIGWDAFGLPAENFAIKNKVHPETSTKKNVANAKKQLQNWGIGFDWSREINTTDPKYYKWTQKLFLEFLKAGLAYEKTGLINWCPVDKTGLANEEVIDGKCERCGATVEKKELRQWYLRITDYAEKLLDGLKHLPEWPEAIKLQQENWIGKSEGSQISFALSQTITDKTRTDAEKIEIFTTRPDTIFGATYLVLAPEHPLIQEILNSKNEVLNKSEIKKYINDTKKRSDIDRTAEGKEKTGIEIKGVKAINPANNKEIPIWIADYVLGSYGTGAIMAVPAHDERDFAFAKKFNLKIISVISAHILEKTEKDTDNELNKYINHEEPYIKEGVIINSEKFSGLSSENAKKKITEFVGGKLVTKYKLRDWVFSRQRYWGEPIPVIHCEKCGVVPVPDKDLPVVLPKVKNYEPTGTGESPLAGIEKWVNTKCPKCGGKAKRETNTMPQWAGSSWYWLRYCDPKNTKEFADKKKIKYWTPVDLYFGGMEHTTLHLLYSRFWNQFLFDRGLVTTSEPYIKRVPHGIILGPDGEKMSKSKGNVVNPDDVAKVYGVDTMRLYMAFLGPHGNQIAWNDKGIIGTRRFIERVFSISEFISKEEPKEVTTAINKTIKKVGEDIENIAFNTAVSALMICVNSIYEHKKITKKSFAKFLQILAPLAPHITEELWSNLGNKKSIFLSKWPEIDEFFLVEDVSISVQINGKAREVMTLEKDTPENEMIEKAKNIGTIPERLAGKEIIKTIAVKNRVVNFVIRE